MMMKFDYAVGTGHAMAWPYDAIRYICSATPWRGGLPIPMCMKGLSIRVLSPGGKDIITGHCEANIAHNVTNLFINGSCHGMTI